MLKCPSVKNHQTEQVRTRCLDYENLWAYAKMPLKLLCLLHTRGRAGNQLRQLSIQAYHWFCKEHFIRWNFCLTSRRWLQTPEYSRTSARQARSPEICGSCFEAHFLDEKHWSGTGLLRTQHPHINPQFIFLWGGHLAAAFSPSSSSVSKMEIGICALKRQILLCCHCYPRYVPYGSFQLNTQLCLLICVDVSDVQQKHQEMLVFGHADTQCRLITV